MSDLRDPPMVATDAGRSLAARAFHRIDGPGSSLDLREFQQALRRLPSLVVRDFRRALRSPEPGRRNPLLGPRRVGSCGHRHGRAAYREITFRLRVTGPELENLPLG